MQTYMHIKKLLSNYFLYHIFCLFFSIYSFPPPFYGESHRYLHDIGVEACFFYHCAHTSNCRLVTPSYQDIYSMRTHMRTHTQASSISSRTPLTVAS